MLTAKNLIHQALKPVVLGRQIAVPRSPANPKSTSKIENLAVSVTGDKAVARFRQDYKAGALAVSSRKTLELVKKGDRWHIVKETVGG